nr:hypothetical protein CFP56_02568 [Quercus suber]
MLHGSTSAGRWSLIPSTPTSAPSSKTVKVRTFTGSTEASESGDTVLAVLPAWLKSAPSTESSQSGDLKIRTSLMKMDSRSSENRNTDLTSTLHVLLPTRLCLCACVSRVLYRRRSSVSFVDPALKLHQLNNKIHLS